MTNVDHIKSNKSCKKTDICLCDGVAGQVTRCTQDIFYLDNKDKQIIEYFRSTQWINMGFLLNKSIWG